MTLLNPRVDLAFKIIFGSEENKDLLISFINSVVSEEDQVVDVEILNPYNDLRFKKDKQSILDIKAKDTNGHYYNIKVQIANDGDYDKRSLYYWARLYANQLKEGDSYCELRKAIGIHVLNFTSVPNNQRYFNKFIITNEETQERCMKDLAIYTIELDKFSRANPKEEISPLLPLVKTSLDRWATFLTKAHKMDRNKLPKELDDPCIKKAFDVLSHISLDEEEREGYEGHLKWLRDEESALRKVREDSEARGRKEEKKEIAYNLLTQHISLPTICVVTGLSEQEILNLKDPYCLEKH